MTCFAQVRAPSLGPSTSLLVTDIQNSTHLWEVLPADVMQRAVQLHHAVLRDRLRKFKGYETATEVSRRVSGTPSPHKRGRQ